ncbi:MAG: recombinase family protein [Prevotellaceae bacterium]|jgi:DNA invertase Pin-like site-specific DNA recombinase|nr:recombinase family protein [Prevotellaceae bacterium]
MKIGYARVSTRQQNLDMQLEAFRKEGCEKIYQEKKSAFADRPELLRALDDLRTGDTLYVWALDRLGRTVFEVIGNVRKIHDKGATLNVIVQKIDTGTTTGKMMIPIFSMLAELEIELKRERAIAGIRIARESGRRLGRKPGLSPEAQETAKSAQKLYRSKDPEYSVREICRMLNITPKTMYKYLDFMKTELKGGTLQNNKINAT